MFLDFFIDIDNYESRKVKRTEPWKNKGIGVDTAYTSDEGYETALIDAHNIYPVERYESREKALEGHEKWIKKSKNMKTVLSLGWTGMGMDEKVRLVRIKPKKRKNE